MALWERREGAVWIGVELDEDKVPDFDATWIVPVDERAAGVAIRREVDMQLGTGAAGTGIAHHPEIVLLVPVHNVHGRIEIGLTEEVGPMIVGFLVELARFVRPGLINGGVEALRRKFPAFHH